MNQRRKKFTGLRTGAAVMLTVGMFAMTACSTTSSGGDNGTATGGSISVAMFELDHITPGWGNGYNIDVDNALFAPLVGFDAENKVELVQAESITTTDNKVWTVKIKPGWTFHNGEEVTAQSYVDGINTAAYGPNAWGQNYQLAGVEGYEALNPKTGEPTSKTLSGLKVIDPHTFEVTLKSPDSQLKVEMAMTVTAWSPLPKAALADLKAYDKAPIGDGPFQMDGTWESTTSSVKVKAYDGYKGTKPKVSNIEFKIYTSADTAYTDLLAGNVDLNGTYTTLPSSKLGQVKTDFADRVVTSDQVYTQWLGFPIADPRYSDVRVRQAISMAIDREAITSKIFGGLYTPANGLLAPGTLGGSPDSCGEYCKYDPAKAKALLESAGGWSGPMEIQYQAGKGLESYFQAVANGIRQNLGISEVKLVASPTASEYLTTLTAGAKGPFSGGWAGLPTPLDVLSGVFQKTSAYNPRSGFYGTEAVDNFIEQAKSAKTDEEATARFHDADAQIMKDFPVAPMYNISQVNAYSDRIQKPTITLSGPMLDQIALK
ncbi:ABC transporter substrate-binding protein [Paenarthrobacter sp. RAF54_2]|uniref:peptide ABC transporter substrate-binding protein n=1 Tax=Paenarthrobacter sp. RAF54_2 TaxID=3233061 RepID=UPI003F9BC437